MINWELSTTPPHKPFDLWQEYWIINEVSNDCSWSRIKICCRSSSKGHALIWPLGHNSCATSSSLKKIANIVKHLTTILGKMKNFVQSGFNQLNFFLEKQYNAFTLFEDLLCTIIQSWLYTFFRDMTGYYDIYYTILTQSASK